jgi:5-methyltetrahydropteroyltriglutamate--homocysteine methyltransferase
VNLPKYLLPTTVIGSYPQPEWLVDRAMLSRSVPRTRMHAIWRLPAEHLEEAQDDATIVAIRDMERAGIDIVTDGEIRRESYSNRFATALDGIDADNPAIIMARNGQQTPVPRVVGKVKRSRPVELGDIEFLRRNTDRAAKITLPGPFTMSQQAKNEFYKDDEELAMAFAEAVNAEALDLQKAGADVIQLDEPWVRNNPELAKRYAVKAINRALQGITVPTVVHLCLATRRWCRARPSRRVIPFSPNSTTPSRSRFRSRRRNPNSISACSRIFLRRRSCWGCSTSAIPKSNRPRSSPIESGMVSSMLPRTDSWSRRIAA